MVENQITLLNKRERWMRCGAIALALVCFFAFVMASGVVPAFADGDDALGNVMNVVIELITKAALYIGIAIVLWGVFQIVLAFRREDSEGISKQITTVVVGSILVGFGAFAKKLLEALGVELPE